MLKLGDKVKHNPIDAVDRYLTLNKEYEIKEVKSFYVAVVNDRNWVWWVPITDLMLTTPKRNLPSWF